MNTIDLPEPKEPEYKSWSREKLEQEYHKAHLLYLANSIRASELEQKLEPLEGFAQLIKSLGDEL